MSKKVYALQKFQQQSDVDKLIIACLLSKCGGLQVTGPSNATVQYFNYAQNSTSSYQLLVQWDSAYRGGVTVDLQNSR